MNQQEAIAAAAREWVGTAFHHQGRVKRTPQHRGGVDCLGLLIGIARELDLQSRQGMAIASLDRPTYAHQPDGTPLRHLMEEHLIRREKAFPELGDIILFQIRNDLKHIGIITANENKLNNNSIYFVHAFAPARGVVETLCDAIWLARIEAVYRFPPTMKSE